MYKSINLHKKLIFLLKYVKIKMYCVNLNKGENLWKEKLLEKTF